MSDFNEQFSLNYPSAFSALMASAHRKPANPLGTPSFNWHLGYWVQASDVGNREAWVEKVERFIIQTYDRIQRFSNVNSDNIQASELLLLDNKYSASEPHPYTGKISEQPTRYQTVQFEYTWQTMPVRTNFELHNEYFTITNSIDLSRPSINAPENQTKGAAAQNLEKALDDFQRITSSRFRRISRNWTKPVSFNPERDALANAYQFIYYGLWNGFEHDIFGRQLRPGASLPPPGDIFTDFRSFYARRGSVKDFIVGKNQSVEGQIIMRRPFTARQAAISAQTILPFMASGEHSGEQLEYTVSTFQDGQTLNITTLGTQRAALRSASEPVTYISLSRHDDRAQIGRLFDALNTTGDSRLAALRDLQQIVVASQKLRNLGQQLREIGGDLPEISADDQLGLQEISQRLSSVSGQLSKVVWNDKTDQEMIAGGLNYRVERSRYYQQQFSDAVDWLRIGRVEGFQPYDRFVKRRLGSTFNFINMVGLRYGRVENTTTSLTQQLRTIETAQTQAQIAKLNETATEAQASLVQLGKNTSAWFDYLVGPAYANQLIDALLKNLHAPDEVRNKLVFIATAAIPVYSGVKSKKAKKQKPFINLSKIRHLK